MKSRNFRLTVKRDQRLADSVVRQSLRCAHHLSIGADASAKSMWSRLRPKLARLCGITPADVEHAHDMMRKWWWRSCSRHQLVLDMHYASDRWCGWRIALIDHFINQL